MIQALERPLATVLGKDATHLSFLSAFTDHDCIRPGAQQQLQGVNQDGFSCAGLTCKGCKPALKIDRKLRNDNEISE